MSIIKFRKKERKLYELFQVFLNEKQLEKAIELIDPRNYDTAFKLGIFYGQQGSNEIAIKIFDQLNKIRPDELLLLNKGVALVNLGDEYQAMRCFIQATRLNPDSSEARCLIGALLVRWEEYKQASKSFKRTRNVPSCYAAVWWDKGSELIIRRKYKMALKYLNKALEIDSTLDEVWVDIGIVSTQLEKIPEAITCFKKALECNSKCVRALHYLGLAYLKSGDNEKAVQQFDEALRVDNTLPETWLGKAIATERLHLIEEATQCIKKALELRPDYDLGWYNQSLLLNRQGRTMEALESFNQALELNPNLFKQSPMRWTIPNENSSE